MLCHITKISGITKTTYYFKKPLLFFYVANITKPTYSSFIGVYCNEKVFYSSYCSYYLFFFCTLRW